MSGTSSDLPRLYTAAEVAEALRCSTWWVQEQVRRERIPYCEVAGGHRFTAEQYAAIVRLLERWPDGARPHAAPPQAVTTDGHTPVSRLRARPPRRLREASPIDTAA